MNTKELKLTDLSPREMRETEGGIAVVAVVAVVCAVLYLAGTIAALSQGKKPHTPG
jgi:hypothetical protein